MGNHGLNARKDRGMHSESTQHGGSPRDGVGWGSLVKEEGRPRVTEFEKWLLGRINWTDKQLKKATEQGNKIFEIIYQSGLDILEEVYRVYKDLRARAANEGGKVECEDCPYRQMVDKVREVVR